LTVSELAPAHLTCPNCLARLINPRWRAAPAPTSTSDLEYQITRAKRVLPLDDQVRRDMRGSNVALAAFAVIFGTASAVSFRIPGGVKVGVALAIFALLSGITIFLQWRFGPDEPAGQIAGAVGATLQSLGGGCLAVGVIAFCVLILLFGACAIMLTGANSLGGKWPP
jgi:hypothetical protein